ncbi:hypothetical protein BGX29_005800 [Mortierella sp. GBA35]|nr:hypothetical protein BGX29_005800 [Mortierella sp. GBA35]
MSDANTKTARLQFLWKASHLFLAQCPGASSHYMSQFLSLANDNDLRLHEDIQTRSCAACGTIFVPGVNSKVRVVPVPETQAEREKRKRNARKKVKQEKRKLQQEAGSGPGSDTIMAVAETTTAGTNQTTTTTTTTTKSPPHRSRKVIHITPHTELAQQQQQHKNQQRFNIRNGIASAASANSPKRDKHANQILNHIVYSCQRCDRITELPGTKQGFLATRVKVTKPVSQRRKLKARQKEQQEAAVATIERSTTTTTTTPSTPTGLPQLTAINSAKSSPKPSSTPINTPTSNTNTKRPASSQSSPAPAAGLQDPKRTKYSVSLPVSPTAGLSRATSAASSAATSPASSPRASALDDRKLGGGGSSNKKKKKGGLASLLASQKPKDSDPGAGASGGAGGDSVLANFLMGL